MFYVDKTKLRILVDPYFIHNSASSAMIDQQVSLTVTLQYLNGIVDCPVKVEFIYPNFIRRTDWRENIYSYIQNGIGFSKTDKLLRIVDSSDLEPVHPEIKVFLESLITFLDDIKSTYLVVPNISDKDPKVMLQKLISATNNGTILSYRDASIVYGDEYKQIHELYYEYGCDFLLTDNRLLTAEKIELAKKHQYFVVNYQDLRKEIGIFLKGHNIYIDSLGSIPIYGLQIPTFYPMTDINWMTLNSLWGKLYTLKSDKEMSEYFRVAIYHRYSFLRFSIDQIKAHNQKAERLVDESLRGMHHFHMSYHLNSFYLNLWGFLDNIAWVFNYLYSLGFNEKSAMKVSFSNQKDYIKKLKTKAPELASILEESEYKDWFKNLTLKRHPAAHREPLFMSPVYDRNSMKLISETHVAISMGNSKGLFEAVSHVDSDYEMLLKLMNKIAGLYL